MCENRAEKVIAKSDEEHLQPFKDRMTEFFVKGIACGACKGDRGSIGIVVSCLYMVYIRYTYPLFL